MTDYITREGKVAMFLAAAKQPDMALAWECMTEENLELYHAANDYEDAKKYGSEKDIEEARKNLVKEIADVQYVLSQLAIFYGINLEEAFNRVADNNMTKVQDGKVIYSDTGKILKPEGYQKPDMSGL